MVRDVTSLLTTAVQQQQQRRQRRRRPPRRRCLVRFVSVAVDARRKHRARRVSFSVSVGLRSSVPADTRRLRVPARPAGRPSRSRGRRLSDSALPNRPCAERYAAAAGAKDAPRRAAPARRHVKFAGVFETAAGSHRSLETPPPPPDCPIARYLSVTVRRAFVGDVGTAYRRTIGCRYTNLAQMADETLPHAAASAADRYALSLH